MSIVICWCLKFGFEPLALTCLRIIRGGFRTAAYLHPITSSDSVPLPTSSNNNLHTLFIPLQTVVAQCGVLPVYLLAESTLASSQTNPSKIGSTSPNISSITGTPDGSTEHLGMPFSVPCPALKYTQPTV